jgi:hypothetical protein
MKILNLLGIKLFAKVISTILLPSEVWVSGHLWWLTPVIPAIQEAEIRRIMVQG